jgi:hypothetical protein
MKEHLTAFVDAIPEEQTKRQNEQPDQLNKAFFIKNPSLMIPVELNPFNSRLIAHVFITPPIFTSLRSSTAARLQPMRQPTPIYWIDIHS